MRVIITAIAAILPALAGASDSPEPPVRLSVKPLLCITDERTPSCEMSFLVAWKSEETGYYCVFNDFEDQPLRCWSERQSGEMSDDRTVQSDFSYWINQGRDEPELALVTVEVLRMDSDDRRRRRRTRHVWDLL